MSFNINVSGTWQPLATGWVNIAGTWQQIQTAWVNVAGTWERVYVNFSASANKSSVLGSGTGPSPTGDPGSTDSVAVTPSGGVAPYTYAWAVVGANADSGPYQANGPTSATTAFSDADSSVSDLDVVTTETWRCTVTDANLDTASVDVTVELLWVNSS